MKNGFRVIDADAHTQDNLSHWVDYFEPEFWDRRPRIEYVEEDQAFGTLTARVLPCELFPQPVVRDSNLQGASSKRRGRTELKEFMPKKYPDAYPANWSAESRLKDMDQYGWDKQVMITGLGGLGWHQQVGRDQDLLWAAARAWHNWCHDFASADPKRLYPVGTMPIQHDIEGLVEETRRIVVEQNVVTIDMPAPTKGRPWDDPAYDPFWSLAEELSFPVSFHGVAGGEPLAGARYKPRSAVPGQQVALDHALHHPYENMLSLAHLVYMGILERFPKMRVSFLEGNAGWLPWWLSRLDDHALESRRQGMWFDAPLLPLSPSEYFRRQGFVACDGDEGSLAGVTLLGWEDHVVWNTDYPHPDAPDPDKALDSFLDQPISEDAKRKILWDNAVRLYGERIL